MKLEFFYSLKQCQPSSSILSKCLCHIKSAYRGDEGGVTNEDSIGVSGTGVFIQSSPVMIHLKTCHEILVLELIGGSCSRQRVGSVHYQFKLPVQPYLGIFIREGIR